MRGWLVLVACAACHREPDHAAPRVAEPPPEHADALARLRDFEQQRRATTDFATLPGSDVALGPDPYRIAALGDGYVGLLRGAAAIVVLDRDGGEQQRLPAPRSPSGLAVRGDDVYVVGEGAQALWRYRRTAGGLVQVGTQAIAPGGAALAPRDVAITADGRTAIVVEDRGGRRLEVALDGRAAPRDASGLEAASCHGAMQVATVPGASAVDCLLDHALELRDGARVARIHHDGPMWRLALHRMPDGALVVAAGGVEDHPLVREDGGFGYIDSFVYVYRLAPGGEPERVAAINSAELGVVTPKWLAIQARGAALEVTAAGYASPRTLTARWPDGDLARRPELTCAPLVPGAADAVLGADGSLAAADPLLDAWVIRRGDDVRVVPVAGAPRPLASRLGELLFFTTLMAPWNSSDGALSRFTCETCHHEGYVDGRTHYTGRDDVFATTRPLLGLGNNRPYFSRALDRTMAQMVHAEFRVANRHNGKDPWFAITRADAPWLVHVPGAPETLAPEALREALMTFLTDFSHRANPAALDHARFTDAERAGARVFAARCAGCHAARLVADDPATAVPFERWEPLILSPTGPIVWNNAAYAKTHVTPYVHAEGARVPTLRRLYKKWPYFTNGHAKSLADLLARFATAGAATYHDGAPPGAVPLTADEQRALRAFLELL
jgi:hypothetical protein